MNVGRALGESLGLSLGFPEGVGPSSSVGSVVPYGAGAMVGSVGPHAGPEHPDSGVGAGVDPCGQCGLSPVHIPRNTHSRNSSSLQPWKHGFAPPQASESGSLSGHPSMNIYVELTPLKMSGKK
jgi:hypothetical protein